MSWKGWLAFAVIGCAITLAYRGDWLAVAGATAIVLLPVTWWVRSEFAATRTRFRESAEWGAALASAPTSRGVPLGRTELPDALPGLRL